MAIRVEVSAIIAIDPKHAEDIFIEEELRTFIIEQPLEKPRGYKFRYLSEGNRAETIYGANSTTECPTYPTIKLNGCNCPFLVKASCVTIDKPYRPHPHKLLGPHCDDGVYSKVINPETRTHEFNDVGIQSIPKRLIEESLHPQRRKRFDPFRTGFQHRHVPSSIDLNAVRLCFQVFLPSVSTDEKIHFNIPVEPVVSDILYDKKAITFLQISRLSKPSSSVAGGEEVILLCKPVPKRDIGVRIIEENNGEIVWQHLVKPKKLLVHERCAIIFHTPTYGNLDIDRSVQCSIQLEKISDGKRSDPVPFNYIPLDDGRRDRKCPKIEPGELSHFLVLNNENQHLQPPVFEQQFMQEEPRTPVPNNQHDGLLAAPIHQYIPSTNHPLPSIRAYLPSEGQQTMEQSTLAPFERPIMPAWPWQSTTSNYNGYIGENFNMDFSDRMNVFETHHTTNYNLIPPQLAQFDCNIYSGTNPNNGFDDNHCLLDLDTQQPVQQYSFLMFEAQTTVGVDVETMSDAMQSMSLDKMIES